MNEPVGLGVAELAFIGEVACVLLLDGCLQHCKVRALRTQVFMGCRLNLCAGTGFGFFQLRQQIAQAGIWEKMFGADQPGIVMQAPRRDSAAGSMGELPVPVRIAFGNPVQALTQIAFDGAYVHLEVFCQLVLVDGVALMQLGKDVGQALSQFFSLGTGLTAGRDVHWGVQWRRQESVWMGCRTVGMPNG